VLGLTVPVIFFHQLGRGAARTNVVGSMSAIALLALGETALPAALQIRHQFGTGPGGYVTAAALAAVAGALAVGYLVDVVVPVPRFDPAVPRGLLALVGSIVAGGAAGYLILHGHSTSFAGDRSLFVGAALGALAGLLGVAGSFVLATTTEPPSAWAARLRPVLAALLPMFVLPPAAFLLCLAIQA
jgi:hypothetical protein